MKLGFYPRLAWDGIRKNRRMYLPYLLTCIGMVMMTYIVAFIQYAPVITNLNGGATVQALMQIGTAVMIFFAALFLFYTNSFLIKRRKKEFGLYHILGMGKGNLSRVLLWESVSIALVSLSLGLLFGIAFSKLVELGFVNLLEGEITYSLSLPTEAICVTVQAYAIIFVLLFLNTLRQIWFASAITLLHSENAGEKPPRANWLLGLIGILVLGAAYYIALKIDDPITAIYAFMIAVLMVIAATYLILIAGSVLFCRILQRCRGYYYKANHFVSVSSMVYRMKRNGAGLASICILATMVLVMISSTSALFIGGSSVIYSRYPREINTWFRMDNDKDMTEEDTAFFETTINGILERNHAIIDNVSKYHVVTVSGMLNGTEVIFDFNDAKNSLNLSNFSDVHQIYLVPIEDYNNMMGTNETLAKDEVLIYAPRNTFDGETFGFTGLKQYKVKEILEDCFVSPDMSMDIVPALMVIVPDLTAATEGLTGSDGINLIYQKWHYCFDTSLSDEDDIVLYEEINSEIRSLQQNGYDTFGYSIECRANETRSFYSVYGGLFYLGVILSAVFMLAAVLIIYYKQISEGYEDQARFEIMQKVGMTKRDIRRSINSQLLMIFFLPLGLAGLHLVFAFPIIEKLLLLFNLNNRALFIGTTLGSFLIFALFYAIVYRITSNAYYKIVSGGRAGE